MLSVILQALDEYMVGKLFKVTINFIVTLTLLKLRLKNQRNVEVCEDSSSFIIIIIIIFRFWRGELKVDSLLMNSFTVNYGRCTSNG